jgi:two-component system chemotaxis response regulator CheY
MIPTKSAFVLSKNSVAMPEQVFGEGNAIMKKVLIVDDSPVVRHQVRLALGPTYEFIEAADGAEGLSKVTADPEIAMVILDVNMPRMTGLEMLERIKEGGKNAGLPVVMLTGEVQHSMIERAKKAGAKGWIVKPFKAELLLAAVRKLVQ